MSAELGRLAVVSAFAIVFLLSGCGSQQQAPNFGQAFGAVDSPCDGAASDVPQHCTAHVLLANRGGEGVGHVTVVVQLKDAKAGGSPSASVVKCGRAVPDTPPGGYVDLVCNFDLPPGKTIAGFPMVESIDYAAASTGSSAAFDYTAVSTMILAVAIVLLCAATLIVNGGRRASYSAEAPRASSESREPVASSKPAAAPQPVQATSHAEYDIPPLPR